MTLDSKFLLTSLKLGEQQEVVVPRLATNVFFVLFEVATGIEFENSNYLFLKELPLGFHSVKIQGKFRPSGTGTLEKYSFFFLWARGDGFCNQKYSHYDWILYPFLV